MHTDHGADVVRPFAGRHVLAELDQMQPHVLDNVTFLRQALGSALGHAGATVLQVVAHRFQPCGVTALALLSESHASLHTYPEFGSAFVDVFTCGGRADPRVAVHLLAAALGTTSVRITTVQRGNAAIAQHPYSR